MRYEPFTDVLCGSRQYQKDAPDTVLTYFLGGRYANLRRLAEENFNSSPSIQDYYGTFHRLADRLQFPDQLCCTVDLATATGKSYVMYAIARIMLAEGAVRGQRVLVLCPSRTIQFSLIEKFRRFSVQLPTYKNIPLDDSAHPQPSYH